MNVFLKLSAVGLLLGVAGSASGALSGNLVGGGDFEDVGYLKMDNSPTTAGEIEPLRPWRFHPGGIDEVTDEAFTDVGKWIGSFGASAFDDPRASFDDGEEVQMINRSVVDGDGILEGVSFRPNVGQIFSAPANQMAGTAKLDFDFFFQYWTPKEDDTPMILRGTLYGVAELPTIADRWGPWDREYAEANFTPLYRTAEFNSQQHNLDENTGEFNRPYIGAGEATAWGTYSDGWQENVPAGYDENAGGEQLPAGEDGGLFYDGTFELSQTFPYYYLEFQLITYVESHPWFWLYGGRPADTMSVAVDDVSFHVSVPEPASLGVLALGGLALVRRRR